MAGRGQEASRPLLDRILVERFVPEAKTEGGIMTPRRNGPGQGSERHRNRRRDRARTEAGRSIPTGRTKAGTKVLLAEYGEPRSRSTNKEITNNTYREQVERTLGQSRKTN
uniref:Putative heat shock protein n=1 Tax=Ixodes ricinus TaxID=34613 RepID=A0A090XDG2_IXORI